MRTTQEIIDTLRVEAPMVFNTLYGDAMKEAADRLEQLQEKKKPAMQLIEDVLDTLVEVGNGVTDEMLHEAADKLFKARALLEGGQDNELQGRGDGAQNRQE